ncbi:MAG: carboxylating nicotinate-nucleotide diphosphorylase [Bacteroidales bacterium]|nr:carboxylating nicotinate-nucleotide diphosphorylase [Bacteroidales bacterium]
MTIKNSLNDFYLAALKEDLGEGDHTSLSTIPLNIKGKARLIVKQHAIIAGIEVAKNIYELYDKELRCDFFVKDGTQVKKGDIAFVVEGNIHSILSTERLILNFMQRMSGIATYTNKLVSLISDLPVKILDTRKTSPCLRHFEKWAVRIGGGMNHRHGLYDMILIKDNHIDFCGGIEKAISSTKKYLESTGKDLKIEIEARSIDDVKKIIRCGGVNRIMLDNFQLKELSEAVKIINKQYETEASGGITEENLRLVAETGVDFISVGALTHQINSVDLSLKAEI